jgi:hypothetical protein
MVAGNYIKPDISYISNTIREYIEEKYVGQLQNHQLITNIKQELISLVHSQIYNQEIREQLDFIVKADTDHSVGIYPNNLVSALTLVGIYPKSMPFSHTYYAKNGYYTFDSCSKLLRFHEYGEGIESYGS